MYLNVQLHVDASVEERQYSQRQKLTRLILLP